MSSNTRYKCGVAAKSLQPRVLFFDFDGEGLGHLRRLSHIARAIQGPCATLFLTGHRAAAWMVPETSEFVHLPSLESLLPEHSRFWNRPPFWNSVQHGMALRNKIIEATVTGFCPDAIFIDFHPKGLNSEMEGVVRDFPAKKYFIIRGILGEPSSSRANLLDNGCRELLENAYDRIFVTTDKRIVDAVQEYGLSDKIAAKLQYTGYVTSPMPVPLRTQIRQERGVTRGHKWVVCSAGGGMSGEALVERCRQLGQLLPDVLFDIVTGPKARVGQELTSLLHTYHTSRESVRLTHESQDLPLLHGACDVLVCHGGYNSLVEGMAGGASIIVVIPPESADYERTAHSSRLTDFYPVYTTTVDHLAQCLKNVLAAKSSEFSTQAHVPLDCAGIEAIRRTLFQDLGLQWRKQVAHFNGLAL